MECVSKNEAPFILMMNIGHSLAHNTVTDALRLIHSAGGTAIQISLGDLSSKEIIAIEAGDAITALKIINKHKFYVVVHGKFLYNFCRPLSTAGWQRNMLITELYEAGKISSDVIIHQGKNVTEISLTREEALQNYIDNIVLVLESPKIGHLSNKIILENSARQGTELGYSLDELHYIYSKIPDKYKVRIGFCLDLCHCFVAGELDVRSSIAVAKWFERFNTLIGANKLTLIHFNDSDIPFNGANDQHACICQGYIGNKIKGGSSEGFMYIAQYSKTNNIPIMLETPSTNMTAEMSLIKSWL